ncbi:MAG: phage portal protein [Desulfobacteraceae bacterium]|nr:phage portal protein [Desulfobacteraceae bacterium]
MWTTKDLAKLAKAGYQNCYAVYACVKQIVDAAGGIPWNLFRRPISSTGKREKLEEHPLLDLMRRPNPQDGGAAFIKNELAFYLIAGNSYIVKVGPERGEPRELYMMRPDRVKVLPGTRFQPIRGYRYTVNGVDRKPDFKPNEVLHLKAFHPLDDWYGLSPIEVAAKQIDIQAMATEWNAKLLENDCRPPGAIVTEGNLDDEQREALEKQLKEKMMGYKQAGRPPVFEAGIKWQAFAITPKDMDWINSDKLNSRKICSVFGVAPQLIGDEEAKTFANYKEARKALYMETILPLMDYLRDEYNNWLSPAWENERLFLEYDKDAIEAIQEERNAVYEREATAHWRTINEKRKATGDDDIGKTGDVILVPATLLPLADISGNIDEE